MEGDLKRNETVSPQHQVLGAHDGTVWTTDKDGIVPRLASSRDHREHRQRSGRALSGTERANLARRTTHASMRRPRRSRKRAWKNYHPRRSLLPTLAGEPIRDKLTRAPGHGAPIGGLKVATENGWFAARPSGTENIYKIYAESFKDQQHLDAIVSEAQEIVNDALKVL